MNRQWCSSPPSRSSGAVLFVSLMILVILTILGIAGAQVTGLEERMAGATRDRNLAFQAAEAALRAGEERAEAAAETDFGTVGGLYAYGADVDPFASSSWTDTASVAYPSALANVAEAPRFVVEDVGAIEAAGATSRRSKVQGVSYQDTGNLRAYRVYARGVGATDGAVVILESTYSSFK